MPASDLTVAVDSGVLIAGEFRSGVEWGAPKGVLILATRKRFALLVMEPVESEVRYRLRELAQAKLMDETEARGEPTPTPDELEAAAQVVDAAVTKTLDLCETRRAPYPPDELIEERLRDLLPCVSGDLRDLPIAVALEQCKPDIFVSDNDADFNEKLERRIGVRIVTSREFLDIVLEHAVPRMRT